MRENRSQCVKIAHFPCKVSRVYGENSVALSMLTDRLSSHNRYEPKPETGKPRVLTD
jgi:hypothetical protein